MDTGGEGGRGRAPADGEEAGDGQRRRYGRWRVSSSVAALRPKSGRSDWPKSFREPREFGSGVYLKQRRLGSGGSTVAGERRRKWWPAVVDVEVRADWGYI